MQVAIPHQLSKETVRERLKARSHTIGDAIPGGMAQVSTSWQGEDRMAMNITAMGQVLSGHVQIEESQLLFVLDLPPALSFVEPLVSGAIRQQGQKMLAPPPA